MIPTENDSIEGEQEKHEKKKKNRKREREEDKEVADPDPVTEAGDGTTKSNSPSKIEFRRGSVYLMKEKRRHQEDSSFDEDQESRSHRKTRWTGICEGRKKDENK